MSILIIVSVTFDSTIIKLPYPAYHLKGHLITNQSTEFQVLITFTASVMAISLTQVHPNFV